MSQYESLDNAILARLSDGAVSFLFLHTDKVRDETERLAKETGRESFRVLDGRLQALRKGGWIKFSKEGWGLTKTWLSTAVGVTA